MHFIYSFILFPLLYLVFLILSIFNPKIREGLRLRKNKSWIRPFDPETRWVWFHVASGELEYAKPVIRELKSDSQMPKNTKILVTYFSPSILDALKKTSDIDLFVPMPWDTPWHWNEFLDHYKPQVLAIARTDTWPNMIWQTYKKKIPSVLFSATLPRESGRASSFFGRLLYASIIENLTYVSCVSSDDEDNFKLLGLETLNITVDGDTRFDQVVARVGEKRPINIDTCEFPQSFVVGSSWPEDEKVLLSAISDLKSFNFLTILAPHEPTPSHLTALKNQMTSHGLKYETYSSLSKANEDDRKKILKSLNVVLVDQVGILADLYRLGQIAFVGGSFKKTVHSVMEPAASGLLTVFGPYHRNNREALALKKNGLAIEVSDSKELEEILKIEFSKAESEIAETKLKILNFVLANQGVSKKIAQWIKTGMRSSQENLPRK